MNLLAMLGIGEDEMKIFTQFLHSHEEVLRHLRHIEGHLGIGEPPAVAKPALALVEKVP